MCSFINDDDKIMMQMPFATWTAMSLDWLVLALVVASPLLLILHTWFSSMVDDIVRDRGVGRFRAWMIFTGKFFSFWTSVGKSPKA